MPSVIYIVRYVHTSFGHSSCPISLLWIILLLILHALPAYSQSASFEVASHSIEEAHELIAAGRNSSAIRLLEALVSDSTNHIESRILLLRLKQDSYLRSKDDALALSEHLRQIHDDDLLIGGESLALELRLRHLQLTLSPLKSASATDLRRRRAATRLLDQDSTNTLALLERAIEAQMLNNDDEVAQFAKAALLSDPRSHSAYVINFRVLAKDDRFQEIEMLSEQMIKMLPEDPYGRIMAGYAAFHQRDFPKANLNFQTALERMPYDLGRAYIDATPYFRDDVAGESGLDSLTYSRNYWTVNDPLYLTAANERQLEHFARLTYADLFYSDGYWDRMGWETDQGQFIVRYWKPNEVFHETRRETDISLFDFREAGRRGGIVRPMIVALDDKLLEVEKTSSRFETWVYGEENFKFYDSWWTDSFSLYAPSAFAHSRVPNLRSDDIEAKNWFFREPLRANVQPRGARVPLTFVASRMRPQNEAFKNNSTAEMDVIVAQGIPVPYRPRRGVLVSPLRIGTFLTSVRQGMAAGVTEEFDELDVYSIVVLDNTAFWSHTSTLSVPSEGDYTLSVEYQSLPQAKLYGVQRTELAPLDTAETIDGPSISDLLLCYSIEKTSREVGEGESVFRRYGFEMFPAPDVLFSVGQPLYVYFEAYDLTLDDRASSFFTVETVLVPADADRDGIGALFTRLLRQPETAAVSVSFDAEGDGPISPNYFLLDTGDIEPGDYDLAIRITDKLTGKMTSSLRTISLQ